MIRSHIREHIRPHIRGMTEGVAGLSPPTNVVATVDGSDIDITWTAASSVDGYNIYQSIDGGTWTKLNATTETGLTYTLTPTDPGEYNFYVTSVRGDKESSPSAETTTTEAMMVQVYTDTLSPRISAVDGTAFVDDTAAITTYADGNHLLEVQDSGTTVASGVLKTQGVTETFGATVSTGTLTAKTLYKIVATELNHFGTGLVVDDYFTSDGTETCDANNTVKAVLTPSDSGAVIVDEIAGTTENFYSLPAEFIYGEASYTVRVKKILPTVETLVQEYTLTSGDVKVDTTTTAMLFDSGASPTDFGAFRGNDTHHTSHRIELEDSAGKIAKAFIGAKGLGEALGADIVLGWDFTSGWTASVAGAVIESATTFSSTGGNPICFTSTNILTAGKIAKSTFAATQTAGTTLLVDRTLQGSFANNDETKYNTVRDVVNGLKLCVRTIAQSDGGITEVTSMIVKYLTDVPVTGIHCITAKDGATRGFTSVDAGFDLNAITKVRVYKL